MSLPLLIVACLVVYGETRPANRRDPMINRDLIEGDMLKMLDNVYRTAVPKESQLWPEGQIPYTIETSLESNIAEIESAMRHIENSTCIKFIKRTDEDAYVRIFDDNGCFSSYGRIGVPQPLSLSEGCFELGTIVHELGHVIGLLHEHNRSDRDNYIEILWNHIDPDYEDQFTKYRPNQNLLINSFDYTSIMMYGEKAFSFDGASKTMKALQSEIRLIEVHQKPGLSESDAIRINTLYTCSST